MCALCDNCPRNYAASLTAQASLWLTLLKQLSLLTVLRSATLLSHLSLHSHGSIAGMAGRTTPLLLLTLATAMARSLPRTTIVEREERGSLDRDGGT